MDSFTQTLLYHWFKSQDRQIKKNIHTFLKKKTHTLIRTFIFVSELSSLSLHHQSMIDKYINKYLFIYIYISFRYFFSCKSNKNIIFFFLVYLFFLYLYCIVLGDHAWKCLHVYVDESHGVKICIKWKIEYWNSMCNLFFFNLLKMFLLQKFFFFFLMEESCFYNYFSL